MAEQKGTDMEIRVSVRQLVEFILREGSIDNRKSGGADTAMQARHPSRRSTTL